MTASWRAAWAAVERAAHTRGAVPATFFWNLAQGSVVPGPAELVLLPLALADPSRAWMLALAATTGSVLGGCIAYWIGAAAFQAVGQPLLALLGISDARLARAMAMMTQYGWWFIVGSTLTPLSTKAVSIGAGAAGVPFPVFAAALAVGRTLRFSFDALLVRASAGVLYRWRQRMLAR
jgi:membrane protein YqaA with SNARE-associated domain